VKVLDLGCCGAEVVQKSSVAYMKQAQFARALACRADLFIVLLGTNDAKRENWSEQEFSSAFTVLVRSVLGSRSPPPALSVVVPPPLYVDEVLGIRQSIVNEQLPRLIRRMASEHRLDLIDAFAEFGGPDLSKRDCFQPDGLHLVKPKGDEALARLIHAHVSSRLPRRGAVQVGAAQATATTGIISNHVASVPAVRPLPVPMRRQVGQDVGKYVPS